MRARRDTERVDTFLSEVAWEGGYNVYIQGVIHEIEWDGRVSYKNHI